MSKGCGFITFATQESAEKAVKKGAHDGENIVAVEYKDPAEL